MKKQNALALILILAAAKLFSQDYPPVLSMQQQTEIFNKNLEWKVNNILPEIMEREGLEMWLIICFENDPDPVYRTLNEWPGDDARRLSALVFHNTEDGLKKLSATWHGPGASGSFYEGIFTDRSKGAEGQFTAIADYIRKSDPKNIGINYDPEVIDDFSHANGLSHMHYEKLYNALDDKYRKRLVSAKNVVIGWYETRTPWEASFMKTMCITAHELIREFYSNTVIIPDVTSRNEVRWWIVEKINEMGLESWFFPSIDIIRSPQNKEIYGQDDIIRRGDLLHCDVGISYMGLTTDMQHLAYVCRENESEAPEGLQDVYRMGLRFQEICLEEMKGGSTGNEILKRVLERGSAENLNPWMYSHPVNYYGHGSGMTIGRTENQVFLPGCGEHPLYNNTTYALEFSIKGKVPEWDNADVSMGFEENMIYSNGKAWLIDGYPQSLYLIR
ncbi:MAG: M24 family metallopeptidase [Marinilabiliaceae bacterium]|jgi:Xaa-Pro aminopeptidase|nr:M24 family metallopeptidase [Marinilabiliaceae bacterium]